MMLYFNRRARDRSAETFPARRPMIVSNHRSHPHRSRRIADLIQIIYASQPFGYDRAMLNGILLDARRCNRRDHVTGALVCRQDIYLQLLEGPATAVEATYARIGKDDRHLAVRLLMKRPVGKRMFGAWAMLHDPATSCIWTQSEIAAGALDRADETQIRGMFQNIADASDTPTQA